VVLAYIHLQWQQQAMLLALHAMQAHILERLVHHQTVRVHLVQQALILVLWLPQV
jgi:hypothetical protein